MPSSAPVSSRTRSCSNRRILALGQQRSRRLTALEQLDLSGTLSDVAHRALHLVERKKILRALEANGGNKSKTAEDLGVSYKTLLNKIKEYAL